MTPRGTKQHGTAHRVLDPRTISPDDVRFLEIERDTRLANDCRIGRAGLTGRAGDRAKRLGSDASGSTRTGYRCSVFSDPD